MIFVPDYTLDYHQLDVRNEYDIEHELNIFLEDCYIKQAETALIITGKGLGSRQGPVIKPLVAKLLKKHKLVTKYKQAGYGNGGEGAFEVYFAGATML